MRESREACVSRETVSKLVLDSFRDSVYVPMPIAPSASRFFNSFLLQNIDVVQANHMSKSCEMDWKGRSEGNKRSVNSLVSCLPNKYE